MVNLLDKSSFLVSRLGDGPLSEHGPLIEFLRYMYFKSEILKDGKSVCYLSRQLEENMFVFIWIPFHLSFEPAGTSKVFCFMINIEDIQFAWFLFDLILYIPSTTFQLNRDGSSWVGPALS